MNQEVDQALLDHIVRSTGWPRPLCERVILDVIAAYDEPVSVYVQRRHTELKRQGLKNEQIFSRLLEEIPARRFSASDLTERQIRRMIYG